MSLRWDRLRVLHEVAQDESIIAAADILHLTGPAVSAQIRKLEAELGVRLIEPDGRGIRLTSAGHVLAEHAARITRQVDQAVLDVSALEDEVAGPLRMGSVNATMREVVPFAVQRLGAEHPRLVVTAVEGEARGLMPELRSGDLDIVIVESWINRQVLVPPGLKVRHLLDDVVDLAVPVGHRLAEAASTDLANLSHETWIACPPSAEAYDGMVQALRERGTEPRIGFTTTDFATQLDLVRAGVAIAMMPRIAQPWSIGGVAFVPSDPPVRRKLLVLTREGPLRPAVAAGLQALLDTAAKRQPKNLAKRQPG